MPLTHDMGLIGFHLTPLFQGVDHWLMPTALFVRRPGLWLAKTAEHRVSVTCSPNFGYMHYLKSHDPARVAGARPRARAHHVQRRRADRAGPVPRFPGGARARRAVAQRDVPGVRAGRSEPGSDVPGGRRPARAPTPSRAARSARARVLRAVAPEAEDAVELVRVGRPVKGCEVRIADADGNDAGDGVVGRILIRGDNVSPGYYDEPALTAESRTADGFLDTGDLGALRDGELVVTGRIKEILFIAGQNHYPQDIELVLAQHADIELGRAAVAGVRPPHAATDDVLVFLLWKSDDLAAFAPTARAVRRVVNERMGIAVAAVLPVRQFPKTTSGKIQRYALARDFEEGRFAGVLAELARHRRGGGTGGQRRRQRARAGAARHLPGGAAESQR